MKFYLWIIALAMTALLATPPLVQADEAAELAKKLANPISSLISVPLQCHEHENFHDTAHASSQSHFFRCWEGKG